MQNEVKPAGATNPVQRKDEAKKDEGKKEEKPVLPTKRKIIIETDGNSASIVHAEVAGNLELKAILQGLAAGFDKPQQ